MKFMGDSMLLKGEKEADLVYFILKASIPICSIF